MINNPQDEIRVAKMALCEAINEARIASGQAVQEARMAVHKAIYAAGMTTLKAIYAGQLSSYLEAAYWSGMVCVAEVYAAELQHPAQIPVEAEQRFARMQSYNHRMSDRPIVPPRTAPRWRR